MHIYIYIYIDILMREDSFLRVGTSWESVPTSTGVATLLMVPLNGLTRVTPAML